MNYMLKHKFTFPAAATMCSLLLLLFPHYSAFAKPHDNEKTRAAAVSSKTGPNQKKTNKEAGSFRVFSESATLLPPAALAKNSSADTRDGDTAPQSDNNPVAPDPAQPPHAAPVTNQNSKSDPPLSNPAPAAAIPLTSIPYDGSQVEQGPSPVRPSTNPPPSAPAKTVSVKSTAVAQKKTAQEVAFNFTLPKIPPSTDTSIDPTAGLPLLSLWQPFMNTSPYSFSSLSHKATILLNVSGLLLLLMGLALMLGKQGTPQRRTEGQQPTVARPIATTL